MSPAIMFCGASDDGERFAGLFNMRQILLSARWSFCLIGVLIGVVRVILLRGSLGWSFFHTENKTSRALAGAHSSYACNPRQLQRVRCSACSRLQC